MNFTPTEAPKIYYWLESEVENLDVLTLENASSSQEAVWDESEGRWEGTYEGVAAKEMFDTVFAVFVFKDAEGVEKTSDIVGYSPERYGAINQNKTEADSTELTTNAALSRAVVVYGDAARAYFAERA